MTLATSHAHPRTYSMINLMFFFDSSRSVDGQDLEEGAAVPGQGEAIRGCGGLADAAIDQALRDVPLPDGLITRLGAMVYRSSDEPADRLDWLGC